MFSMIEYRGDHCRNWAMPPNFSTEKVNPYAILGGQCPPYLSMRTYHFLLPLVLFGFLAFASTASATEPFGRLAPYWRTPTPYYAQNPRLIQPKKDVPPQTVQKSRPQPTGPHAYPYGYFGAQTRPYAAKSFGYYEAFSQTSYGWGY
jgi:hypothetical protein